MTPQQIWYGLPVPGSGRARRLPLPGHAVRRARAWRRAVLLGAGAVVVGLLVLDASGRWEQPGERGGPPDPSDAAADGEAFVDAYLAGGLPAPGSREAVLRIGRAACTAPAAVGRPPDGAAVQLSPEQVELVAELARRHLCAPTRTC